MFFKEVSAKTGEGFQEIFARFTKNLISLNFCFIFNKIKQVLMKMNLQRI